MSRLQKTGCKEPDGPASDISGGRGAIPARIF